MPTRYSYATQCAGKVQYRTKRHAKRAARGLEQRDGRMRAYRCWWCPWFHIGHRPRRGT